jgi:hypothetical protein
MLIMNWNKNKINKLLPISRILLIIVSIYDIINYDKFRGFMSHVFSETYTKKYEYFIMIILLLIFFIIEKIKVNKLLKLIFILTLAFFSLLTWMGLVHYRDRKIIFLVGLIFIFFEFYIAVVNYRKKNDTLIQLNSK